MMIVIRLAALVALMSLDGTRQVPVQPDVGLVLRAVRSYRADQGRTDVNAFVQIPYAVLTPSTEGTDGQLSYRVSVRLTDSTGLTLMKDAWQNHAPAALRSPAASGVEMIRFSLAPGRYQLTVNVQDSVSGRIVESTQALEGFKTAPAASDLLLSPGIRPATDNDTVPRAAELRWGKMLVTAAAQLQLTPLRSNLFYLLEAYSPAQETGNLRLKVIDSTGKTLMTTSATQVVVPAGGGVLKGQLDLAGLPAGQYTLTASLDVGNRPIERSAGFWMAGLDETLEKDVARREAAKGTDEGYFSEMDEAALQKAKEPLILIAASGELSPYSKSLTLRAKRRFLSEFWQRRDPTPNAPGNEARERFYDAVAYAERTYAEKGRGAIPGWKTDRGRIYVKNGSPDDELQRPMAGRSPPYEVWRYRRGKDRYYIFADRSGGLGNFQLIKTNDVKETGSLDWAEILHKEDAVLDIERFLGFPVYSAQ
jgi:GWxTD domain-containing protein